MTLSIWLCKKIHKLEAIAGRKLPRQLVRRQTPSVVLSHHKQLNKKLSKTCEQPNLKSPASRYDMLHAAICVGIWLCPSDLAR